MKDWYCPLIKLMGGIMLQCKLASALAMPLTGDRGLFDQAYKLYQAAVQEAKGMNAKERKQDTVYISSYVKARDW